MVKQKLKRATLCVDRGSMSGIVNTRPAFGATITNSAGMNGGSEFIPFDSRVKYETDKRHYAHLDCAGRNYYIWKKSPGLPSVKPGLLLVPVLSAKMLNKCQGVYSG